MLTDRPQAGRLPSVEMVLRVRLPRDVAGKVARLAKKRHRSRAAIVRDLVERMFLMREFEELHAEGVKRARAKGIVSEEQIFEMVS